MKKNISDKVSTSIIADYGEYGNLNKEDIQELFDFDTNPAFAYGEKD